jgi:hypothetical protein
MTIPVKRTASSSRLANVANTSMVGHTIPHSQKLRAVFGCIGGSAGLTWIKDSFAVYHPKNTASPSMLQPPPTTSITSLGQPLLVFPRAMMSPNATRVFGENTMTSRMSRLVRARIRPSHGQGGRDSRQL